MSWLSKLIVVDNLRYPKYKWNSAEFLIDLKRKNITLKLREYVGIF
jgi:hypothetical protein